MSSLKSVELLRSFINRPLLAEVWRDVSHETKYLRWDCATPAISISGSQIQYMFVLKKSRTLVTATWVSVIVL